MNYLTSEDGKSINTTNPLPVVAELSGSNTEETNGANIATKSNLVAGESPTGKQRPLNVDEDGKLQVGGITTVGIDQTTPGTTNKVVAELSGSKVIDAVIDISEDAKVSTEIDFRNYKYLSFLMPAAWDTATLTIYGSAVAGGTKVPIKNDVGQTFPLMTVAVDTIYTIDANALMIAGVQYLAFVSSADQTADRTIKVMLEQ